MGLVEGQDAEELRQEHHFHVFAGGHFGGRRDLWHPRQHRQRGSRQKQFLHVSLPLHLLWMSCAMFGTRTDSINKAPITLVWVLPVMLASPIPLRRLRMTKIDSPTPTRFPEPPKMLTPPSRTMVMISSSKPCAMSPRTEPRRAA